MRTKTKLKKTKTRQIISTRKFRGNKITYKRRRWKFVSGIQLVVESTHPAHEVRVLRLNFVNSLVEALSRRLNLLSGARERRLHRLRSRLESRLTGHQAGVRLLQILQVPHVERVHQFFILRRAKRNKTLELQSGDKIE